MGKEGTWQNKNVDLKQVSEKIKKFFYANKFSEVQNFDDPGGSYIQIQAKKTGAFQSLTSQRKSIQVTIRGDANNFLIFSDTCFKSTFLFCHVPSFPIFFVL